MLYLNKKANFASVLARYGDKDAKKDLFFPDHHNVMPNREKGFLYFLLLNLTVSFGYEIMDYNVSYI